MANHSQRGGWRLAGRVLGGLAAAWWVVAVVGGAIADPDSNAEGDAAAEAVGVVVLVAANVGAFAAALVRERLGSRLMELTQFPGHLILGVGPGEGGPDGSSIEVSRGVPA